MYTFYTSPSMLFKRAYTNPKIYSSRNIFSSRQRVITVLCTEPAYPIGTNRLGSRPNRSVPNRLGPRLLQPIRSMLSLYLNTPPQAQLEALRDPLALGFGSSWLHASFALVGLFDSARFDSSGRLVCSLGPCQLSCCRGVGVFRKCV